MTAGPQTSIERLADLAANGPTSSWRDDVRQAVTELEQLQAWKVEAMAVLGAWERVWRALGEPGPLGGLKSTNSLAEVERLVAERARLRAAVVAHQDCCGTDFWPELRTGSDDG